MLLKPIGLMRAVVAEGGGDLAWSHLTDGTSTNNPATTASISPTSGSVVFVSVVMSAPGGSTTAEGDSFAVSGCGLTWSEVGALEVWGSRRATRVFIGTGTPQSGTLSLTWTTGASQSFEQMKWSVDEVDNADTTTPTGTAYTASGGDGTSVTVTVSETPDSGDHIFAVCGHESNEATSRNSELDTTLHQTNDATGSRSFHVAYDSAPDSSPTPGFTWSSSSLYGAVAFIVHKAA